MEGRRYNGRVMKVEESRGVGKDANVSARLLIYPYGLTYQVISKTESPTNFKFGPQVLYKKYFRIPPLTGIKRSMFGKV